MVLEVKQQISELANKYVKGEYHKYLNPGKVLNGRQTKQVRMQHIFSSVLFQIGWQFFLICNKITQIVARAMAIDHLLTVPDVVLPKPRCTWIPSKGENQVQDFDKLIVTQHAMRQVLTEFNGIQHTIALVEEVRLSIDKGLKISSKQMKCLVTLIDGMRQMEPGHEIKLDTVLVSLACNCALIQNKQVEIPHPIDIDFRTEVLKELGYVNHSARQLSVNAKAITITAFFVAHKTFTKLMSVQKIKRLEKQRNHMNKIKKLSKKRGTNLMIDTLMSLEPDLQKEEEVLRMETEEFEMRYHSRLAYDPRMVGCKFLYE